MKFRNWFWGLFFVAAAILILLSQLGYLANVNLFSLVCTILLLPVIIKSSLHLNFGGILIPIALLAIIYAEPLGLTAITPWPVLIAAVFASIGLHFIFHKSVQKQYQYYHDKYNYHHDQHFETVINNEDSDEVECNVNFGASTKYVNSNPYKRGYFRCSFGGLKVYFDKAVVEEQAEIIVDASFSGVELYVPKNWILVNQVNATMGGIEEKNRRDSVADKKVILKGNVKFAGVEIIYV